MKVGLWPIAELGCCNVAGPEALYNLRVGRTTTIEVGYKLTLHRLDRQKIMAPVKTNVDGEQVVDWDGLTRLGGELLNDARVWASNSISWPRLG